MTIDEGPMIRKPGWGISHRDLMCEPLTVTYDFRSRVGVVNMPEGDCTDMTGAIRFFERMDQDVEMIQTYSGDDLDTVYVKRGGEWCAVDGRRLKVVVNG